MNRLESMASAIKIAAGTRAVWFGFLGSTCILLGSLSPAYLPQASPIWSILRSINFDGAASKWVGTSLTLIGLALLMESWLRLRPARRAAKGLPQLRHWAVLLIMGFPLLFGPPVFSHDAYSYAAQGWLIVNDLNPYQVGPGVLPGYFADQVAWVWRDTPAPYGPLSLQISEWIVRIAAQDPFRSAVFMRIPALLGVGMIGWSIPRIARKMHIEPAAASWFAMLNPILVIDFIGGAHNDAIMVGFMLLGIWVTLAYRQWVFGALIVGVAAAIKQPAFLASIALPFLVTPWTSWRAKPVAVAAAKALASLLLAVAVFAGISWATGLGFGWINAVNVPGRVFTVSPFTLVGQLIQYPIDWLGLDATGRIAITWARSIGFIVAAVGIVWFAVRYLGREPLKFVSWSLLLFVFCTPAIHSWYMLWGGVLFPMTRPSNRMLRLAIVVVAVLLTAAALNFAIRNGPWLLMPLLLMAVWASVHYHELTQDWEAHEQTQLAP